MVCKIISSPSVVNCSGCNRAGAFDMCTNTMLRSLVASGDFGAHEASSAENRIKQKKDFMGMLVVQS